MRHVAFANYPARTAKAMKLKVLKNSLVWIIWVRKNKVYDVKYRNLFDVYKNTVSICIYKNYWNDSFWNYLELEIRIILHVVMYVSWKVNTNWKIVEFDWNWHVQTWNMKNMISYTSKFNGQLIHRWFFKMNCFGLLMTSAEQVSVRLSLLFEVLSYVFTSKS